MTAKGRCALFEGGEGVRPSSAPGARDLPEAEPPHAGAVRQRPMGRDAPRAEQPVHPNHGARSQIRVARP